jgi:hypothetical protein
LKSRLESSSTAKRDIGGICWKGHKKQRQRDISTRTETHRKWKREIKSKHRTPTPWEWCSQTRGFDGTISILLGGVLTCWCLSVLKGMTTRVPEPGDMLVWIYCCCKGIREQRTPVVHDVSEAVSM